MRHFNNIWSFVPIDEQKWREGIQPKQNLAIEIGAGAGYHPVRFAQGNPETFLVAIERTQIKAEKMMGRVSYHPHLKNVCALHADAVEWICQNVQENEVSAYFMLYPNPYPKEKQANKRFMNMPFMHKLLQTLKTDGEITLATNMLFYYEEAKKVFCDTWGLKIKEDRVLDKLFTPRTHFEKKYLARGEACYNVVFYKS